MKRKARNHRTFPSRSYRERGRVVLEGIHDCGVYVKNSLTYVILISSEVVVITVCNSSQPIFATKGQLSRLVRCSRKPDGHDFMIRWPARLHAQLHALCFNSSPIIELKNRLLQRGAQVLRNATFRNNHWMRNTF